VTVELAAGLVGRRRAASYQEALLRYVHSLAGGVLEDTRLGVTRHLADAHVVDGLNPRSVSAVLSLLERRGRVVSSVGHRSLDNALCRLRLVVLAEPDHGQATPPARPVGARRTRDSGADCARGTVGRLADYGVPGGLIAELTAHIDHLAGEVAAGETLLADAANEIDFATRWATECETEIDRLEAAAGDRDRLASENRRLGVLVAWRDRQRGRQHEALAAARDDARRAAGQALAALERARQAETAAAASDDRLRTARGGLAAARSEVVALAGRLAETERRLADTKRTAFYTTIEALHPAADPAEAASRVWKRLLTRSCPKPQDEPASRLVRTAIDRVDHDPVENLTLDIPGLDRQTLDEQLLGGRQAERLLVSVLGSHYRQYLQMLCWLEDHTGGRLNAAIDTYRGQVNVELSAPVRLEGRHVVAGDGARLATNTQLREPTGPVTALRLMAPSSRPHLRRARSENVHRTSDRRAIWAEVEDSAGRVVAVNLNRASLDTANPPHAIDGLEARPGRLFGLLDASDDLARRRLAAVAVMLGATGIDRIALAGPGQRDCTFSAGGTHIAGLTGRCLYSSGQDPDANAPPTLTLRASGLRPWDAELVAATDSAELTAIAMAIDDR
jgi:hypothetical protein